MSNKKKIANAKDDPPPPSFRITPREIMQMFLDRWLLGLFVAVIAAGAFIVFQPKKEPLYRSDVTLLFESRKDRVLNIQEVVETGIRGPSELNFHMEQLRSKTFLDYVLASLTPEDARRIQEPYLSGENSDLPPPSVAAILQPNVSVNLRRGTTIVVVTVMHRSPETAAFIADRYARRYIDYNLDHGNSRTNQAIVFLRTSADDLRAQVHEAEGELQRYREEHKIASLGENQNVILQKVAALGSSLVAASMQQVEMRSLLDKVEEFQKAGRDLQEIHAIASHGHVSQLATRLATLRSQRVLLEGRYLRKHPSMIQNELETSETARLLDDGIKMAIADLQARYNSSVQLEKLLRSELDEAERLAHELEKTSLTYKLLEEDAARKRTHYARIVDRLTETNVTSQLENANIKIFDPPYIPSAPASGGPSEIGVKAGVIGACMLLFVPIGLGFLDTRVKTASHVEDSLGAVLLGAVKRIKGLGEAERAHVFRLRKDDALAESYRGIYSEMDIRSVTPFPKILAVTSSLPGDGKSLTASNLAAVFAAHGRRTILVDCDLRRPTLHRYFGVDGRSGWVQWLDVPPELAETTLPPAVSIAPNLDLLAAGGVAKNPTEMLERLTSSPLFKRLLERYDLVLIDTPPVTIFPDALLLSRHCNELIYVCKFGTVRMNTVRRTLSRIRETGVTTVGLVLNEMPEARFGQHGYNGYGAYTADYYRAYAKTSAAR